MKSYPSISRQHVNQPIYAFDKLDGSNIRAEWSRKKGFYKFGTRNRLLDTNDPVFGNVPNLVLDKYGDSLSKVFKEQRWDRAMAFFEFRGPNSFAMFHDSEDEKTVTLIDMNVHKKGLLEPHVYLDLFGHLDHAPLLYEGPADEQFLESVHSGTLLGMSFEGVVCKGPYISPGMPLMFKVKNNAWIAKLRKVCKGDQLLFRRLM